VISALASETIVHIATTPEKYDRHHTLAVTASGSCVCVCVCGVTSCAQFQVTSVNVAILVTCRIMHAG
jgi:hypothetical protein